MMKRLLISLLLLLPMLAVAQVRFGYLSYKSVIKQLPEYQLAENDLTDLKDKYDQEAKRGEEEFQRKFSEFLQGQKEFPQNILVKRQTELQDLMERSVGFREECQTLLKNAEQEMFDKLTKRLDSVIVEVGMNHGYAMILNTDDHNCPFLNPALGDDATNLVLKALGLKVDVPEENTPVGDTPEVEEPQPATETIVPENE